MPALTRWYIKAALLFFLAALLAGVALAIPASSSISPALGALTPVYFHMFMVGWVSQLIFGVVYWMFPKATLERPRGSEPLGWATFGLLNVGLLLRVVGEPMLSLGLGADWGWLLAASAVLQWLAGILFVVNTWGRVKER